MNKIYLSLLIVLQNIGDSEVYIDELTKSGAAILVPDPVTRYSRSAMCSRSGDLIPRIQIRLSLCGAGQTKFTIRSILVASRE